MVRKHIGPYDCRRSDRIGGDTTSRHRSVCLTITLLDTDASGVVRDDEKIRNPCRPSIEDA
jgi:hypothetical protein